MWFLAIILKDRLLKESYKIINIIRKSNTLQNNIAHYRKKRYI